MNSKEIKLNGCSSVCTLCQLSQQKIYQVEINNWVIFTCDECKNKIKNIGVFFYNNPQNKRIWLLYLFLDLIDIIIKPKQSKNLYQE